MKEVAIRMSIEIRLPQLYDEMKPTDYGVVELWHVQEQQVVTQDQPLLDLAINRGVATIPVPPLDSPCRVIKICQEVGATVHMNDLLVLLEIVEEEKPSV